MVCKSKYIINMLIASLLFLLALFNTRNAHSQDKVNDDPWESTNRTIFEFNNKLDDYLFTPIAKAWREIPDIPRKPIANAANMAKTPINLGNAILQLNKQSIGDILGRFVINMTFGLGGMFDIASTQEFGGVKEVQEQLHRVVLRIRVGMLFFTDQMRQSDDLPGPEHVPVGSQIPEKATS